LNQNKNTNVISCRNAGNCPYSQTFGVLGLSLFSVTVNPRLPMILFLSLLRAQLLWKLGHFMQSWTTTGS